MSRAIEDFLQRLRIRYLAPVARPVAEFWTWWTAEIVALLPPTVRSALTSSRKKRLVNIEDSSIVCSEWDPSTRQVLKHHTPGAPSKAGLAATEEFDETILCLPVANVLIRPLTLPLAAEENLREVLSFELDRQTPFTTDQAYYDYCVTNRDAAQGTLTVDLIVSPRQFVDDWLGKLRQLGLDPDVISVQRERDSGETMPVNLLPESLRRARRLQAPQINTLLGATVAMLLVAALLLPLALSKQALEELRIEQQLAEEAAADGLTLRRDVERLTSASEFLIDKKLTTVPALRMLTEVTRVLPDNTWLTRIDINGPELQLRGQSTAAAALIEILESSPIFRDARFRSPVVQIPQTDAERFHLSVELEQPEST